MTDIIHTATTIENIKQIKAAVPKADLYDQLAEEAAELAQAANKMARVLRGTNPTPKSELEAHTNLVEEYTDVKSVAESILDIQPDWLVGEYKLYRWRKRLDEQNSVHAGCSPDYCDP